MKETFEHADELALFDLIHDLGSEYHGAQSRCWCEMRIGNPMFRDHTQVCKRAWHIYERLLKRVNP